MTLNNVNALATYSASQPGELVNLLGYYQTGDGGGGMFYWDSTSSDVANAGTIFNALPTGRWKRLFDAPINVRWFGAKGDGITDDTSAITRAVNVSSVIAFPDGNYLISQEITIPHDLQIISIGKPTITKPVNGDLFFNFFNAAGFSLKISGITFDGGLDSTKSYWASQKCFNSKPYRCRVDKPTTFIRVTDASNVDIIACTFKNLHGYCIWMANVSNANITDSRFTGIEGDAAIQHWPGGILTVDRCKFENIGSLPASFMVDGTPHTFDLDIEKYYTAFGDAVSCFTGNVIFTGSYCKNIERLAIAHDLNFNSNLNESQSIIEGNVIVYDSLQLRNSNPPGAIWCELVKNTNINNNKILLLRRSTDEKADFRVIHFTSSGYDNCKVLVSNNNIEAEGFNSSLSSGITTALVQSSSNIVISDNIIKGPFKNVIEIGPSTETQINSSCSVIGNTLISTISPLPLSDSEAVIRLDADKGKLPKNILINNNTLSSPVDNESVTPLDAGRHMIHVGSVGASFDPNITISICGNNLNGGTFEAKGFKIKQLDINNNTNLGGIEVDGGSSSSLTGININGNNIIKDSIIKYASGSLIGNRNSGTITITGVAGLQINSNVFSKAGGPSIVTQGSVDFVRSQIAHNLFSLYSDSATGIDIQFPGTGNYYGLHIIGNMFAGNSTPNTYGIKYGIASGRFFGVVADNRFSDLVTNEQNRALNTNV